jgi:GTP-dependent phosphoenolpyruvate carboxykinase
MDPAAAYAKLTPLFAGSDEVGRTMYVMPYVMGPARLPDGRRSASS